MTATSLRPSLPELRAAARALRAGQFRPGTRAAAWPGWAPEVGERAVLVVGCGGGVGATTVAVAIASGQTPARVVECCPAARSGLVAASFTELGETGGWVSGRRGDVLLERRAPDRHHEPPPASADSVVTVCDVGADPLLDLPIHLPVVLVTRATLPGLRRLEALLLAMTDADVAAAAVIGPPRRRWPKPLVHSRGRLTSELEDDGRLVIVPLDTHLAVHGLDAAPLPPGCLAAGRALADLALPHTPATANPLSERNPACSS